MEDKNLVLVSLVTGIFLWIITSGVKVAVAWSKSRILFFHQGLKYTQCYFRILYVIMVLSVINLKFWFQCPRCHICIEKNGGCNHMQCYNCKHDFCWMCLGDWKSHGSEYYECSRYKENPNIAHESVHAQAREALKKYLHYYERVCWFPSCNVKAVVKW